MSDAEIIDLLYARDERALREVRAQYGTALSVFAFRILGDRRDAEECINDVLLRLWQTVPPMQPQSLPAYLHTLVRNRCFDLLSQKSAEKRGGGQIPLAIDELSPYLAAPDETEQILDRAALSDAIGRFLGSLTPESRMIFLARYWSFQPIAEIAKQHACTAGKVKMRLRRTKDQLREFLIKEGFL